MAKALRVIPLTGTDATRRMAQAVGEIETNEIHTTSDQKRFFVEGRNVAPRYHGLVANEGLMLNLDATTVATADRPGGCFPSDFCKRTDTDSAWFCISNRGKLLTDWMEISGDGDTIFDGIDGGPFSGTLPTDILDGGPAFAEPPDIVDGGDFDIDEDILDGGTF